MARPRTQADDGIKQSDGEIGGSHEQAQPLSNRSIQRDRCLARDIGERSELDWLPAGYGGPLLGNALSHVEGIGRVGPAPLIPLVPRDPTCPRGRALRKTSPVLSETSGRAGMLLVPLDPVPSASRPLLDRRNRTTMLRFAMVERDGTGLWQRKKLQVTTAE